MRNGARERTLFVVADDYGIGPETSRGIRELAREGIVTGTLLMVNSPYAAEGVREWQRERPPADLGWHPVLTMDTPLAPVEEVSSLLTEDGRLAPLPCFLKRWRKGEIEQEHVFVELAAQYRRFVELVGYPPPHVACHHHLQVFPVVGRALREILRGQRPLPMLRRVREAWRTLVRVPSARVKRLFLSTLGRFETRRQRRDGFPGADCLGGFGAAEETDDFFGRWLRAMPGRCVELMCHPGHFDATLEGRDGEDAAAWQERRACEWRLLASPKFREECENAGFRVTRPSDVFDVQARRVAA
ncbi:MAG: ChbG/HpnK family deacetylase [Gemmataceae bacterium]